MDIAQALRPSGDLRAFRIGTVVAVAAAGVITVQVDGASNVYPVLAGVAAAVGDSVLVARDGRSGGVVLGRIGTPGYAPAIPVGVEPPAPGVTLRTTRVMPLQVATHRTWPGGSAGWLAIANPLTGRWSGGPWHRAVAFYGNQLEGLGADTAQAHSASVSYRRMEGFGGTAAVAPRFHALIPGTLPAGDPGFPGGTSGEVGTALKQGQAGAFQLPTGIVTALLTGAAKSLGLGAAVAYMDANPGQYPYAKWNGPVSWAEAFALTVTYYA